MKNQVISILGRRYQIQTNLSGEQIEKTVLDMDSRLKLLSSEYPLLDRIDTLILYIFELQESKILLEKKTSKESKIIEKITNRLELLEEKIKKEIKDLTI